MMCAHVIFGKDTHYISEEGAYAFKYNYQFIKYLV